MTTLSPADPSTAEARTLFIAGTWQAADDAFERFDPAALDRSTGRFAAASEAHVEAAYTAASAAQPAWGALPAPARAEVLRRAADHLESRTEAAARRLTLDMGKCIRDARGEVLRSVSILRYFAGELLQPVGETYASTDPSTMLLTVEQPLGVVCAITPWNFPFAIPTWKLAPALGFGNSVVWKPAEAASGSAVMLTESLAAGGLPDGVLNLITGSGGRLSGALTGDRRLAAITFTGSGGVGSRLRQAVADRNVKVQLELGGKNPAIVLADADLADAAVQVTRGAMLGTGQRCTATSRVFVERTVASEFEQLLRRQISELVVGDPLDERTDLGPVAFGEQLETVSEYLKLARGEQAEVFTAGDLSRENTCFMAPALLTGVEPHSRLMREEIFGPVLVLKAVDDLEAALAAANDTEFGLSSAVFTRDIGKAMRFIRATESGVVHINRETAGVEPHVPFGGIKGSSSMSREQGKAARQFFTTTKTVYIRSV
ncbi:MAG TPA: aldehyde dehydrogenase family protein [Solirubrobacteraceae bacterium]|nr:aldehyde dehydrogenase family protein [Solirubrobacteraceae bacterium]